MPIQIKMPFTVSTNCNYGFRSVIQPRSIKQKNINMMPATQSNLKTMSLPKSTGGCGCGK